MLRWRGNDDGAGEGLGVFVRFLRVKKGSGVFRGVVGISRGFGGVCERSGVFGRCVEFNMRVGVGGSGCGEKKGRGFFCLIVFVAKTQRGKVSIWN